MSWAMAFQAEGIASAKSDRSVRACRSREWRLLWYRMCQYMGNGYQEIKLGRGSQQKWQARLSNLDLKGHVQERGLMDCGYDKKGGLT